MNRRELILLASGIVGGAIAGFAAAYGTAKVKAQEEKRLELEIIQNAYSAALDLQKQNEMNRIANGDNIDFNEIAVVGGYIQTKIVPNVFVEEPVKNDYHKAIEAVETPVETFVDGGVNDYGISYIEEEEFLDEDGRSKMHVDMLLNNGEPAFWMDGVQLGDWDIRLGDSILVDFYRLVPPGVVPILYVRNHRTDEDYEVVRVEP